MSCQPASYTTRKQFRFTMQELQYYLPTAFINMHLQLKFTFFIKFKNENEIQSTYNFIGSLVGIEMWTDAWEMREVHRYRVHIWQYANEI